MRRNKALLLHMLQAVEANTSVSGMDSASFGIEVSRRHSAWSDEITYHLGLLTGAGFLHLNNEDGVLGRLQLTWAGHELLDGLHTELNP